MIPKLDGGDREWLVLKSTSQILPLIQIPKENITPENSQYLKNIIDSIALSLNDTLNCPVIDANLASNVTKSKLGFIPNSCKNY